MAEEIGFENGRNSNFQGLVTLTLTLDPAIRHTVMHHSSTSTYIPYQLSLKSKKLFVDGRTDVRTDGHFSPSNIIRSTFGSRPKKHSERHKHCALAVVRRSRNFCPAVDLLPGGTGRPTFNQLEMVTTFTYKPSLVKIDARNFELSW